MESSSVTRNDLDRAELKLKYYKLSQDMKGEDYHLALYYDEALTTEELTKRYIDFVEGYMSYLKEKEIQEQREKEEAKDDTYPLIKYAINMYLKGETLTRERFNSLWEKFDQVKEFKHFMDLLDKDKLYALLEKSMGSTRTYSFFEAFTKLTELDGKVKEILECNSCFSLFSSGEYGKEYCFGDLVKSCLGSSFYYPKEKSESKDKGKGKEKEKSEGKETSFEELVRSCLPLYCLASPKENGKEEKDEGKDKGKEKEKEKSEGKEKDFTSVMVKNIGNIISSKTDEERDKSARDMLKSLFQQVTSELSEDEKAWCT